MTTLRIAVVQMPSHNRDVAGNLLRATRHAQNAAAAGARLAVFPEFMPTGYSLHYDIWDSAERSDGRTVQWLRETSRRLGIWLGTSFLEASGEDFFNTFVMTGPDGEECGRVRKQVPADAEAFFFRGQEGSHVIETALGRIGVGICAEGYYTFLAAELAQKAVDLILMPHSAPDMSTSGGLPAMPGTHLATWYARRLGVPVAMVNKVGAWTSRTLLAPPLQEVTGFFPGLSAIADRDGTVLQSMDAREGVGVADVHRPSQARTAVLPALTGIGISELMIGGMRGADGVAQRQASGSVVYAANPDRKAKARAISNGN